MPVPMMPRLNMRKVAGPPMGRSASAAWPAVSMCVIPAACNGAAVPRMMKNAMRFENPIPR